MEDLIIVHPDMAPWLIQDIRAESIKRMESGKFVYLLPGAVDEENVLEFDDTFASHDKLVLIPQYFISPENALISLGNDPFDGNWAMAPQYLHLKSELLKRGSSNGDLSGTVRSVCVQDVYDLVSGDKDHLREYGNQYFKASKYLGLKNFGEIMRNNISANFLEDLCA